MEVVDTGEVQEAQDMRRFPRHPSDPPAFHHRARLDRHHSLVIQADRSRSLVLELAVEVEVLEVR